MDDKRSHQIIIIFFSLLSAGNVFSLTSLQVHGCIMLELDTVSEAELRSFL